MSHCAKCGAPLPPGAQFCPRCGTPLQVPPPAPAATPPPAPPPAPLQPARARTVWWIVPLVLVVLGGIAWLILAGLPFGGRDRQPETPRVETIAEGTVASSSPRETGTIIEVPGERPEPEPTPEPVQPERRPERREQSAEGMLSDEQASATLRDFVTSRDLYRVGADCMRIESRGFRNRGYAYEVWHTCGRRGASRLLGRWRVDALTRDVFRQHEDGRFLRP